MKLNLKAIAAAVALLAAGSASAFTTASTPPGGSSLVILAFNAVTQAYYVRDTGFILNTFLPSNITTGAGDGGVTGDKTPEAGLTLNSGNTASFADNGFTSWLGGQNVADIRWTAVASESQSLAGTSNVSRMAIAINGALGPVVNSNITNAVTAVDGFAGILTGVFATGPTVFTNFTLNLLNQVNTLGLLDQASSLFYLARSQGTLANSTPAVVTQYGNSAGFATITLEADGDFVYSLAPAVAAVPLPAAAWLLGAGLVGLGGALRRRKAGPAAT